MSNHVNDKTDELQFMRYTNRQTPRNSYLCQLETNTSRKDSKSN